LYIRYIKDHKSIKMKKLVVLLTSFIFSFLISCIGTPSQRETPNIRKKEKFNMLLIAKVSNVDSFKIYSYDVNKPKFKNWCDASKCVFGKVNDTTAIELFFDIDADKLQEFLADPVVSENINRFNFVPIRYKIEPYNNN